MDVTEKVSEMIRDLELSEDEEPIVKWNDVAFQAIEHVDESKGLSDLQLYMGAKISLEIRARIMYELGYTCSTGIAHNKTLAKLISALNKPNKQTVLRECNVLEFMKTVSMNKIRGLGGKLGDSVTQHFNVDAASDLWGYSERALVDKLGVENGTWLFKICRGICNEPVEAKNFAKSMVSVKNFTSPLTTEEQARQWISILSSELFTRIQEEYDENRRWPKTLTIHSKNPKWESDKARSCLFPSRIVASSPDVIASKALYLFDIPDALPCIRLGLAVKDLSVVYESGDSIAKWLVKGTQSEHQESLYVDGSQWTCVKCNKKFLNDPIIVQEHEDFHFAQALMRQDRFNSAPYGSTGTSSSNTGSSNTGSSNTGSSKKKVGQVTKKKKSVNSTNQGMLNKFFNKSEST